MPTRAHAFVLSFVIVLAASTVARSEDKGPGSSAPGDPVANAGSSEAPAENASDAGDGGGAAADAPPVDPVKAAAEKAVAAYLDAVKAKKWDVARKLIHPKTLEVIAEGKKRRGVEDHEMAPWAKLKESYLTQYVLAEPVATAKGAMVVASTEQIFHVEEHGVEDDLHAEYLVMPLGGKWYVTDRRVNGQNLFPADTLPQHYKGYFDGEYVLPPPEPVKKKHKS